MNAQKDTSQSFFASPLDIPLFLSGNFGELRSTHFHSGLDFKTQQVIGKPVYAAADGYVSRIKVQSSSYGKSIYLTHENGFTTVYAHLNNYIPVVAEYVKEYQYRHHSFEVDLVPDKEKFVFKKGQLIGISGNTGNSGGPHLHFEIRDQAQRPLNPLLYNFNVKDDIDPVIQTLVIYPVQGSLVNGKTEKIIFKPVKKNGVFTIPYNPVSVFGKIGFGIETYDYLNGSTNKCTVFSIELSVDDTVIYYTEMESFSFDESGYVSSYIDYGENIKVHRLFPDPNNKLGIYRMLNNRGIAEFNDSNPHSIKITVKDAYNNKSVLSFSVKPDTINNVYSVQNDTNYIKTFFYNMVNNYEDPDFKISIPENGLFDNINFKYSRITNDKGPGYSDIHLVHSENTPLFKPFTIYLKAKNIDDRLKDKAYIVLINKDNEPKSIGGEWQNGFVVSKSKFFGKYFISVDTISPEIIPISFKNNRTYMANDTLTFRITDKLTGIKSFTGLIDNNWGLFEYDMKNDLLFYIVDKSKLNKGQHNIEIKVTDYKENESVFKGKFISN